MDLIILSIGSYIWGSINPAIMLTKHKKGIDIRSVGRHNPGATNVAITLGFKSGVGVALLDILKGVLPVLIARIIYPNTDAIWFLMGVMVMLGHMFPVFYQFKGGKGVASLIGVLVTAAPLFGLSLLSIAVLLLVTTKYITIPTVLSVIVTPIYLFFSAYSLEAFWIMLIFMVISLYKQRLLIIHIIQGKESSLSQVLSEISEEN